MQTMLKPLGGLPNDTYCEEHGKGEDAVGGGELLLWTHSISMQPRVVSRGTMVPHRFPKRSTTSYKSG